VPRVLKKLSGSFFLVRVYSLAAAWEPPLLVHGKVDVYRFKFH